jgi:hypothetical protein
LQIRCRRRWLLCRSAGALVDRITPEGRVTKTTSPSRFGLLYLLAMLKQLRLCSLHFRPRRKVSIAWLDLVVASGHIDYALAV